MQYKDEQRASCINTELKRNPKTVAPTFSGVLQNSRGESMQSWNALYCTVTVNIQKKIISLKRKFQPTGFHLVGTEEKPSKTSYISDRKEELRPDLGSMPVNSSKPDQIQPRSTNGSNQTAPWPGSTHATSTCSSGHPTCVWTPADPTASAFCWNFKKKR